MAKATVNMTNWQVYVYEDQYNLSGVADNHPSLGKNTYVAYTSHLERSELVEDVLTYETRNTIYVCPLKFMSKNPYGNVVSHYKEELLHRGENGDNDLDLLIAATAHIALGRAKENVLATHITKLQERGQQEIARMKQERNAAMYQVLEAYENSIYIEVGNVGGGSTLAYHLGNYFGIVEPDVHVGMFQDSVLYMLYASKESEGCSLDFRYFPRGIGDVMETYSWSDNIEKAIIKNETGGMIRFNGENIAVGETKVFTPEGHCQGLISPDCYNGKSMFGINESFE